MARSIAILLSCVILSAGCLTRRTEGVPDPNQSGRDSAANGGMDAAGNTGVDGSQADGMVVVACDEDKVCARADQSRCDEDTDTCAPCKVSRDCEGIAGKRACIKDVGCFECSDDDTNACKAPATLCHPTRRECVACTAANTAACDADGKVCEPQSGACVTCLSNAQCTDVSAAKCEPGKNECGKCTVNDDCAHLTDTPYCEVSAGKCVACTANEQCTDPKASRCDLTTNTCARCGGPSDCIGIVDAVSKDALPLCVSQECVQCTRADRNQCGNDVCNALTKRCEDGVAVDSAETCAACVSDDQCKDGYVCREMTFGAEKLGYFCLPVAPAVDPCARPYDKFVDTGASIDGDSAAVCSFTVSTCAAHAQYNNNTKPCGVNGSGEPVAVGAVGPSNALCGQTGIDDGYCVVSGNPASGTYRCTVACSNNNDCPDLVGPNDPTCVNRAHETDMGLLCSFP